MKILAIADIDDFHWNYGSGQADVLLSCGDVSDQVIRTCPWQSENTGQQTETGYKHWG